MNTVKCLALLFTVALLAAAPPPSGAAGFNFGDWQVNTEEIDSNFQTGAFTSPVPVHLQRPGSDIRADRASGNWKTKQATLNGNVSLHDQNGVLTGTGAGGRDKPATLTCDNLQIDGVSKVYTATGRVHFTQGGSSMTADRAIMNGFTHDLHLYGHVRIHQ